MKPALYIGLMSGTSADAIDAALVDFSCTPLKLIAQHSRPFDRATRAAIQQLAHPGDNEIDRMGHLDRRLGEAFAEVTLELLELAGVTADQVTAIGSHGQTLRHRPPGTLETPFSLQVGDPNIIAQRTGIATIADFRRRDMAAGGQGAPLVPAFHQACFASPEHDRAIINIGGIANLTWLPRKGSNVVGFDTGPGNGLMDAWIGHALGKPYDDLGQWAASGQADPELLERLLAHPYFERRRPKSTGPEEFHRGWLETQLAQLSHELKPEDVQATLLDLTVSSIAREVDTAAQDGAAQIYICGGGAYNLELMHQLQSRLPQHSVHSAEVLGLSPEWIEAVAFAWLAQQTWEGRPGNLPCATGAQTPCVLGAIYPA